MNAIEKLHAEVISFVHDLAPDTGFRDAAAVLGRNRSDLNQRGRIVRVKNSATSNCRTACSIRLREMQNGD